VSELSNRETEAEGDVAWTEVAEVTGKCNDM